MTWTVQPLNAVVEKELLALPADMQSRLLRIAPCCVPSASIKSACFM